MKTTEKGARNRVDGENRWGSGGSKSSSRGWEQKGGDAKALAGGKRTQGYSMPTEELELSQSGQVGTSSQKSASLEARVA